MTGKYAIAGSDSSGLWCSSDFGHTWEQYINVTYQTINSVFISDMGNSIIGGTNFAGYALSAPCFYKNTKLLIYADHEERYEMIKNINVGDYVKTLYDGYKKVQYIGKTQLINDNLKPFNSLYRLKGSNFIVTGKHGILVDEISENEEQNQLKYGKIKEEFNKKILYACASDKFKKIKNNNEYTIYHMVLESDDKNKQYYVFGENNVIAETMSRKIFKHYFGNK